MIKLGKVKEMFKIQGLGKDVQSKVKELLKILDSEYGEDRDVDKDWRGFIAIIEEEQDFEVLKKAYYLDVELQNRNGQWKLMSHGKNIFL